VISRWLVLVVVVSGLVVAGCGDDDETSDGGGGGGGQAETEQAPEPSKPAAQTVDISATDFAFDPANPKVKAGVVTFNLTNDGQAPHALEVEAPGGEVETEVIQAGQSASVEADLSEGGRVVIYCPVGNHRDMGMEGEIQVSGGGSASKDDSGGEKEKEAGDDSGGGRGSYGY
jgi:plastocyanin